MINGTLIVQALNFFIAYCIIDRLLVRPVTALIMRERQEENALRQEITQTETHIQQYTFDKEKAWQQYRSLFSQKMPLLKKISFSVHMPPLHYEIDPRALEEEKNRYQQSLSTLIIDKVTHHE